MEINDPKGRWKYHLLRRYTKLAFLLYYKRVEQIDMNNIPRTEANILALNHQNTLSDPLAVAAFIPFNPTFLTRADVFKNPKVANFLYFLNMIPIYRQRDGGDTLKKNEEVFNICIYRLNQKKSILIFPEGSHEGKYRVRPLKKGLARIAFNAAERSNFTLPIYLQPIGVNYTHYTNFQSSLNVWYGTPFDISPYYDTYKEDSNKAVMDLTRRLRVEIQKYTLHISHVKHYEMINLIREWFVPEYSAKGKYPVWEGVKAGQRIIKHIESWIDQQKDVEEIDNISGIAKEYDVLLKELRLRDHIIRKAPYSWIILFLNALLLLFLLPVFIYGAIFNYLPYHLVDAFPRKNMKDPQFHSSVEIVSSMVLFPIWYLLLFVLCWIITQTFWIAAAFLVSLPITGVFAARFSVWIKKWWSRCRFKWMKTQKDVQITRLISLRKSLATFVQGAFNIDIQSSTPAVNQDVLNSTS